MRDILAAKNGGKCFFPINCFFVKRDKIQEPCIRRRKRNALTVGVAANWIINMGTVFTEKDRSQSFTTIYLFFVILVNFNSLV